MNSCRTVRKTSLCAPVLAYWRYLQLEVTTADQPLRIENLRSRFTAYPFEERARFESDDPVFSQIWQIGWRTARLDAP